MDLHSVFATLSFVFSVAAYVPYTTSVWSSTSRPTLSTWLSWWIMDIAILAGMFAKDAVAMQMIAYVIGCAFVIGACLWRKAILGWTRLDSICMVLVFGAIVLWTLSGDADFAIIMSLVAVTIGCIPMLINVWHTPAREPFLPWVLITIGGLFGVAAIPKWTIADALTPIVFATVQVGCILLISRKFRKKNAPA